MFMRGIQVVVSSHKGPVMWKVLTCNNIIMKAGATSVFRSRMGTSLNYSIIYNDWYHGNVITWKQWLQLHLNWWCSFSISLTRLSLDKIAAILADDNFKCIFLIENYRIPIWISRKFVPRSPTDNKPALAQVIACCLFGNKPLPELMLTQLSDTYMPH